MKGGSGDACARPGAGVEERWGQRQDGKTTHGDTLSRALGALEP